MPIIPNTASAAAPPVLLPYQQRWVADKSPVKVAEKSRRTGLTWAEAADNTIIAASAGDASGMNVYYIAYNQDMTIEYIQACAMWARAFDYAASEIEEGIWPDEADRDKNIKTFTIQFPSGFRIVALSSRPTNLRGKQGVTVIDEAAHHEKLGELLKAAMALLIWGGSVRIISTHNGDENEFNMLVNEVRAGKRGKKASVHRIEFRQAVDEGLYRRVCARLGQRWSKKAESDWMEEVYKLYGDGSAEELDVIPSSGTGAFLSSVLIEARMHDAPVLRWVCSNEFATLDDHRRWRDCQDWIEEHLVPLLKTLNPNLNHHYGMDFGRSGDLSVIAPLAVESSLLRRCPFLVELRNVPFKQQEQILFYVIDHLPRFLSGKNDARGNGQQLAEAAWQKYGKARVEPVMLSETWYREHMPAFQAAFQDAMILVPRHVDVRDDLRALKMIRGVARIPENYAGKGADGKQRHADAAIALVLAYAASLAPILAFDEIQTIGAPALGVGAFEAERRRYLQDRNPMTETGWGTVAGAEITRGW